MLFRYSSGCFATAPVYGLTSLCAGKPRTVGTLVSPAVRTIAIASESSPTCTCAKRTMPLMVLAALAKCGAMSSHDTHPSAWNATTHASRPFSATSASKSASASARTGPSSG